MKNLVKNFLILFTVFLAIALFISYTGEINEKPEEIGIDQLVTQLENEEIKEAKVRGNKIEIVLRNDEKQVFVKEPGTSVFEMFNNLGIDKEKVSRANIQITDEEGANMLKSVLLTVMIPFLIIGIFIFFMMRSVQGANSKAMMFGQSQAKEFTKDPKNKISFKDVAGANEAKEELSEVVEFLKNPKKFIDLGARIPRGVLLLGSPGTGKTLMARAVAGEADVPFFSISGSEFVEMFVGVGASRVRDLFKKAKKNSPCIIFIDEIDAVGRKRGSGMGGSHDEREQTLNQILVEMDGFDQSVNVIVIAATNRPDVLDPALLRPGRFDRQVMIDVPDIKDREAILKVHARKKPLAKDVSLRRIAERTPGFSGADLANLLNEAAILTARKNKKTVNMDELFDSIEKVMLGPERKTRVISPKEKEITAYHEAGHAIVAHYLPNTDPVQKISVISRGMAGGYTIKIPTEDKHLHTRSEYIEEIAVLLAGLITEKEFFGDPTTGATSDLRRATRLARKLITDFGMSNTLGLRTFGEKEEMIFLGREIHEQRDYSEKIAEQIDKEISHFIDQASHTALGIIRDKKDVIKAIVKELLDKETIEKERFEEIIKDIEEKK